MERKPRKVSPFEVETIDLAHRVNYKLIDPTTVGSKNLTFGMVVVEPGGICEPGHDHDEQEEIFFCLSGKGIVLIGQDREKWAIQQYDAVFIPPFTYHNLVNESNFPLTVLWIQSPAGWVFDKHPELKKLAEEGRTEGGVKGKK
jgi:mannose-6-phosphate isomerase-like protein (cupin superfamily)